MNITLSIDEKTLNEARKVASAMGKSLNELIREDMQRLVGQHRREEDLAEFQQLGNQGESQGWKFNRDELHERT